jgi:hypothetical protein
VNLVWTLFGWAAAILNVWGNLALTTKGIRGWIIRIACNLCWMPYGVYTRAWALIANHLLFVAINAYGWWKWRRDDLKLQARTEVPGETTKISPLERARRMAYVQGWDDAMAAAQKERSTCRA